MVTQYTRPTATELRNSSQPNSRIHTTFIRQEPGPPPPSISLPKGDSTRPAILKHCTPKGIPMIVTQHRRPASAHIMPKTRPPSSSQKIFPSTFIDEDLSFPGELL